MSVAKIPDCVITIITSVDSQLGLNSAHAHRGPVALSKMRDQEKRTCIISRDVFRYVAENHNLWLGVAVDWLGIAVTFEARGCCRKLVLVYFPEETMFLFNYYRCTQPRLPACKTRSCALTRRLARIVCINCSRRNADDWSPLLSTHSPRRE